MYDHSLLHLKHLNAGGPLTKKLGQFDFDCTVSICRVGWQSKIIIDWVFRLYTHRISITITHQACLQPRRAPRKIGHGPMGSIPIGNLSEDRPLIVDQPEVPKPDTKYRVGGIEIVQLSRIS